MRDISNQAISKFQQIVDKAKKENKDLGIEIKISLEELDSLLVRIKNQQIEIISLVDELDDITIDSLK